MTLPIKLKRGLKANLPPAAAAGEPLFTTDTKELFIGTGDGISAIGTDPTLAERVGKLEKYRSSVSRTYTETFTSPKVDVEKTTAWYSSNGVRTSKIPSITESFTNLSAVDQINSYGVNFDVENGLVRLSNTLEGVVVSSALQVVGVDKLTVQSDYTLPSALGVISTKKVTGEMASKESHLEPTILVDRLNRTWVISSVYREGIYAVVTNPGDSVAFEGYLHSYSGTGYYVASSITNAVVDHNNNVWIAAAITNMPGLIISIKPDFQAFLNPISVRGNNSIYSYPPFLKLHVDKNNRIWYSWSYSSTFYYGCITSDGTFFIPTTSQTFNPSTGVDNAVIVEDRMKGYICFIIRGYSTNTLRALRVNYDGTNQTPYNLIGKASGKWLDATHDESTGITTILSVDNNAPVVHRLNLSTGSSTTLPLTGFMAVDHSLPIGFVLQDNIMRVFYHQQTVGSTRLISIDLATLSIVEPDTLIQSGTNTTRVSSCIDGYGRLTFVMNTSEYSSNYSLIKMLRYDIVPTSIAIQISPDDTSWFPITLGEEITFPNKTDTLKIKIKMQSPNPGISPLLRNYRIALGGTAGEITQTYTSSSLPTVTPTAFVTLTANQILDGGEILWEVSNNGGGSWQSAELGQEIEFANPINSDLRVRAILHSPASESSTPSIRDFTVTSANLLLNPSIADSNLPQRVIDLETNLLKTNFQLITYMNATKYGLKNMVIDTFTDLSGVDIPNSQAVYDHIQKKFTTGIVDIVPLMTANDAPTPFIVSADSVTGGAVIHLFDRNLASGWSTTVGGHHWIKIFLDNPAQIVDRYLLSGGANYAPTTWQLQGSNNNTTWDTLHSVSGYVWTRYEGNEFTIPTENIKPYKYYRFYSTSSQYGSGATQIQELRLQKAVDQNHLQSKPENTTTPPNKIVIVGDETVNGGSIRYLASRDGGNTWTDVPPQTLTDISSQPVGTQLVVKAIITGNAELNAWGYYYE
ncbi:F5/8 type C domain-containing protein [Brevibacillus sp. AG162]|uniref:hyaluronate lyase N-terminal domain-containing protein n=1 Tax=Brevibacillus sp. AG162 TaxID=2572910 RepID=UPI001154A0EA|nr:discoidin domain-containing protein [Brevibacillus sp. AG162]TQK62113.1 F5/8 type C domain-containing protein [Brevibacillus sp. AG162]